MSHNTATGNDADVRGLLFRARDSILLELRRRAYDRLLEPTTLLLEIDAALGLTDHTWYSDPGGVVADSPSVTLS